MASSLCHWQNFHKDLGGYSLTSVARTPRLIMNDIMHTSDTTYS